MASGKIAPKKEQKRKEIGFLIKFHCAHCAWCNLQVVLFVFRKLHKENCAWNFYDILHTLMMLTVVLPVNDHLLAPQKMRLSKVIME